MNTILTKARRRRTAALLAVVVPFVLSTTAWLFCVAKSRGAEHRLLMVGDSTIANYRLLPGDRLEDALERELGDGWAVRNEAGAGTRPAKFFLRLAKSELLGFSPDLVIIGFAPQKLSARERFARFDRSNADLRFLPLDQEGVALYRSLTPALQERTVVEKLGLLFLFLDVLEPVGREWIYWPYMRAMARCGAGPARDAKIRAHAVEEGHDWSTLEAGTYDAFLARQDVRDLEGFLAALARRRVPALLVLMPEAHPGLARETFPAAARANLATAHAFTRRWAAERGVAVLDFDTVEHASEFRADRWGDIWHLKSKESFRYIARTIGAWIPHEARGATDG